MTEQILLWPISDPVPSAPQNSGRAEPHLRLDPRPIHVWAWNLDISATTQNWEILDQEETARALRFVFPRDRDRFVRAHAIMRTLLCGYINVAAAELNFARSQYGKPQIVNAHTLPDIRFNLSHSAGLAVLAVAREYEIGVDIEVMRPIDREVAEGHFSPQELLTLQTLPPEEWLHGFYRCWTSKEALLKGEGLGLNLPLDAFDVEVDPHRPPMLLDCRPPASIARGWNLIGLKPAPNAVCTLAVRKETPLPTDCESMEDIIQCFAFAG